MVPYVTIDLESWLGIDLQIFFVLVAIAIVVGVVVYDTSARRGGLVDAKVAFHLPELAVLGGFTGAHLLHVLAYHPELLSQDPWVLFKIWGGISSIGGFLGGALLGGVYLKLKKQKIIPYGDRIVFGMTAAWIFGRLGCTLSHDHPGLKSDFFLAVAYPGGARHDLGFYEWLMTLVLMAIFIVMARKPRRSGLFMATAFLIYAPLRFAFDFLRISSGEWADRRYAGLTPAQYGVTALFALGVYLLLTLKKRPMDVALWPKDGRRPKPEGRAETTEKKTENTPL